MAITQYKLYSGLDKNFSKEFDSLSKDVLEQYLKRNMGLLDFLTFYDSYKTNIVQLNNILSNLANAYENIDYVTGTDFFYK
jgi:cobalt-zinc-cadmium efflux system outer membrane protein